MEKWARAKYQPCIPLGMNGTRITGCDKHIELSRKAAQEGIVLLKNENNNLPLCDGAKIAVFGKAQFDYVRCGGGSGEVYSEYTQNIYDGLKQKGKKVNIFEELSQFYDAYVTEQYNYGGYPGEISEPDLPDELIEKAAEFTDNAIITISRFSREEFDCKNDTDDSYYYLSVPEQKMVDAVCKNFKHITVLLNTGSIVDTAWFADNAGIESAMFIWQGGMEGGCAAADVLTGEVCPSGKLADTCVSSLDDYISTAGFYESDDYVQYVDDVFVGYRYFATVPGADKKVIYPFGHGLSYTRFDISDIKMCDNGERIFVSVRVSNTGNYAGKEVVQVYSAPEKGIITKPARELRAFAKTPLMKPGESCDITMSFKIADMAVYDDWGQIKKSAYIIEKGTYRFFVGNSSKNTVECEYTYTADEDIITAQLSELCPPRTLTKRLTADGSYSEAVNTSRERIMFDCGYTALDYHEPGDNPIKLIDVANGSAGIDEFISQLKDEDLVELVTGQPNLGVANTCGIGMPDNSKDFENYGIPRIMTADGPAGLRINRECGINTTAFPIASMLAATWNTELVEKIGEAGAAEVKENNIHIWLTPALNIHRSPLCGRNFEYYSEDPLIAGKMAAAMVRGIQSQGICAVPKHFVCNNKETGRRESDSVVSERALRKIYLKGFKICVEEAKPRAVMTSYNKMNGIYPSENSELIAGILRGEWGFDGMVMSDWGNYADHIYEIQAGNDIKMPFSDKEDVLKRFKAGEITRSQIAVCAKRVLKLILDTE